MYTKQTATRNEIFGSSCILLIYQPDYSIVSFLFRCALNAIMGALFRLLPRVVILLGPIFFFGDFKKDSLSRSYTYVDPLNVEHYWLSRTVGSRNC